MYPTLPFSKNGGKSCRCISTPKIHSSSSIHRLPPNGANRVAVVKGIRVWYSIAALLFYPTGLRGQMDKSADSVSLAPVKKPGSAYKRSVDSPESPVSPTSA